MANEEDRGPEPLVINTGVNISKAVAFAVLDIPPGVYISKAVAYAVLGTVDPPSWSSGTYPNGTVGVLYNASVPLTAGTVPITYTVVSGAIPTGTTLSGSGQNAVISGTPTVAGTFTFTIQATNAYGSASQNFAITISLAAGGGGGSYTFAA